MAYSVFRCAAGPSRYGVATARLRGADPARRLSPHRTKNIESVDGQVRIIGNRRDGAMHGWTKTVTPARAIILQPQRTLDRLTSIADDDHWCCVIEE